jgi:hypothetical protein
MANRSESIVFNRAGLRIDPLALGQRSQARSLRRTAIAPSRPSLATDRARASEARRPRWRSFCRPSVWPFAATGGGRWRLAFPLARVTWPVLWPSPWALPPRRRRVRLSTRGPRTGRRSHDDRAMSRSGRAMSGPTAPHVDRNVGSRCVRRPGGTRRASVSRCVEALVSPPYKRRFFDFSHCRRFPLRYPLPARSPPDPACRPSRTRALPRPIGPC